MFSRTKFNTKLHPSKGIVTERKQVPIHRKREKKVSPIIIYPPIPIAEELVDATVEQSEEILYMAPVEQTVLEETEETEEITEEVIIEIPKKFRKKRKSIGKLNDKKVNPDSK